MPSEPLNLRAVRSGEQVTLTWETSSATNVMGFLVEQSVAGGAWTKLPQLPATQFSLTLAQASATEYRVWDLDKVGPVTASVLAFTDVDLSAPVLSFSSGVLSWNALVGQGEYKVAIVRNPTTTRETSYVAVKGTTFTPTPVPGFTINYGCAGMAPASAWAKEVTVSWPGGETGKLVVGLNGGGWGSVEESDIPPLVKTVRVENAPAEEVAAYAKVGISIIDLVGHYSGSGIAAVNASVYASEAVGRVKGRANTAAVEILNEPENPYFWGSNARTTSNRQAYANLVNVTAGAFASAGLSTPLLVSFDGGFAGDAWGIALWPELSETAKRLCFPTVHPYGGTGERAKSALGNQARVTEAASHSGKRVWVTEIGWPTAAGQPSTGDSLQWSEAEQAANIEHFVTWCVGLGTVGAVIYFNFRDYGTNMWYGIESHEGRKKLGYAALASMHAKYGA